HLIIKQRRLPGLSQPGQGRIVHRILYRGEELIHCGCRLQILQLQLGVLIKELPESAKIQGRLPVIQDAGETDLQEINLVSSKIEIHNFSLRRVGETVQLSELSVYTLFQ